MKYIQRDIVEINFLFPDGTTKPHPAVIISNDELQEDEGFIYLAMISSKAYNDKYNFELFDAIPMAKKSYVKCQLIVGNVERDVVRKISRIKEPYFSQIVDKVINSIF